MLSLEVTATLGADDLDVFLNAQSRLLKSQFNADDPYIECVAIVGTRPDSPDMTTQDNVLRASNARLITYDVLVQEALDSYRDYLEADDRVARLNEILEKIGKKVEETVEAENPGAAKEASEASAKPSPAL